MSKNQWQNMNMLVAAKTINVARAAAIELGNMVIQDTPVLDGELKKSWNTSIGAPEYEKRGKGASQEATNQLLEVSKKLETGQELYFNNPMPYAARIEYEGWSSEKAPNGMVEINTIKWHDIVARKSRELQK